MDGFEIDHDQLLTEILQDYDLVQRFSTTLLEKMVNG